MTALLTLADAAERLAVSSASVRRLIQAGRLPVLKELGGWQSLEMVLRYAHLGADHLAEHAERISAVSEVKPLLRRVV